ncbi:MAG TPA: PIG-L family deacetylase [Kouleothrix sp.]|uniref:PIG-L deacetylase family protein n=1 Tax=Kouleothrix sp. TaxID=2779161 RepID=UPI002C0AC782|nr:PIG-L family deacetylase [Kouleothrix sp.]HRC77113.1 PIG-L family deacetylase [Kouleothrix sp.]
MSEQELPRIAMVIVAHPDDAEFGCAGSVAAWAREGWEIYFVICTDASGGGADEATDVGPAARKQITDTRKAEQREAARILGVKDVIFLDRPDGLLQPTIDLRRDLVRLMRRYRPTRVLCQSPERTWKPAYPIGRHHPDHLAAGEATIAALYPACQNPWDFPELLDEGLAPHKVRELYVMGAPEINHAVDISATLDAKIAALAAHVSQLGPRMPELEPRLRAWAAETGKAHEMAAAEVFHRTENG